MIDERQNRGPLKRGVAVLRLPQLPGAPELNRVFREGVAALQGCEPFERAMAFFLFAALQPFFFDGNKRTGRFMMNGVLMSHGMDAISVPAAKAQAFNEKMAFLAGCHPDASAILPPPACGEGRLSNV